LAAEQPLFVSSFSKAALIFATDCATQPLFLIVRQHAIHTVYVFFTPDRQIYGLTVDPDGANLVRAAPKLQWRYSDQIVPALESSH
jgi:hypothetical protein